MGLESFFVKVLFDGVEPTVTFEKEVRILGKSEIKASVLQEQIIKNYKTQVILNDPSLTKYLISDAIELVVSKNGEHVDDVFFEGCLSWFGQGLDLIFDITKKFEELSKVRLFYPPQYYWDMNSKEKFLSQMESIYSEKIQEFKKLFNNFDKKVAPSKFYEDYEKRGTWQKFKNLFKN